MSEPKFYLSPETIKVLQEAVTKTLADYNKTWLQMSISLQQATALKVLITPPVISALQQAAERWKQQRIDFTNALLQATESISKISDSINQTWVPFLRSLEEMKIDAQEMGPIFIEAGFWLSPSMPISLFRAARDLKKQGELTPSTLKHLILATFREEDNGLLKEMVNGWYTNPCFAKRKSIFDDAVYAHSLGKYTLSVPTLLPQIEGLMVEIVEGPYGKLEPAAKEIIREILELEVWLTPIATEAFEKEMRKFYAGIAESDFSPERFADKVKREWKREPPELLNRHAILHGVQIDYDSEENSLRAFLFLDMIDLLVEDRASV